MTGGEIGEGFGDTGEQFYFLLRDVAGEAANAEDVVLGDKAGAEALIGGDQRACEAGESVAVGKDGFALDGVESLADFGGRVFVMIEEGDEGGGCALEVDVVFPEGVVGVD